MKRSIMLDVFCCGITIIIVIMVLHYIQSTNGFVAFGVGMVAGILGAMIRTRLERFIP